MSSRTLFLLMAVSILVLLVSTNGISVAHGSSSASSLYKCSFIGGAAIASDGNASATTTTTTTSPYEIYLSSTNPALYIKIRQVNYDGGGGNFTHSMAAANKEDEQQQQQATKQERLEINVKLVNPKTNGTIKDIIYLVNNNASVETEQIGAHGKESNVYWDYSRFDKLGTMWLDVWSLGSAKYTTSSTTATRLTPESSLHHNSFLSRDEHARIHIITFEVLKSDGEYHAEVEITGINHCFNSDDDNSSKIKRDWTVVIEIVSDDSSFCQGDRQCWHE
jgi:hypothetical protein